MHFCSKFACFLLVHLIQSVRLLRERGKKPVIQLGMQVWQTQDRKQRITYPLKLFEPIISGKTYHCVRLRSSSANVTLRGVVL